MSLLVFLACVSHYAHVPLTLGVDPGLVDVPRGTPAVAEDRCNTLIWVMYFPIPLYRRESAVLTELLAAAEAAGGDALYDLHRGYERGGLGVSGMAGVVNECSSYVGQPVTLGGRG